MKKIFLFLTISLFSIPAMYAVVTWDGTSSEMWTQGTGTEADPYLIETPANLAYLSTQVTAGEKYTGVYFQQTEDFDLQSKTWTPIGTSTYKFAGIYNGANKYVSNIKTNQYGLFGITENTKIKNVVLKGTFSAISSYATTSAPLIGEAQGITEIFNCHNLATISENTATAGLIAKASGNSLLLQHSSNESNIKYVTDCGGLVGLSAANITIKNCFNKGNVTAIYSTSTYTDCTATAGGLVGRVGSEYDITIYQSYNLGNIKASASISSQSLTNVTSYAAGLVGNFSQGNKGIIKDSYNRGSITAGTYYSYTYGDERINAAGLVNGYCDIIACYSNADISASNRYGTTSGYNKVSTSIFAIGNGMLESCYAVGNVKLTSALSSYSQEINMPVRASNTYHNLSSTGGTYKSEEIFKSPTMIPLLNTIDDYFTMDLEGINDGYPILKWQAGPRFTITGSCDANRGTVKGGGEYAPGNTATLTATPKKGCTFVGWSDGNTDNPRTVTVEGDATYIAQFTKNNYTIYVNQDCTSYIE